MTTNKTKSQDVAADVVALLRARNPLLWIVTREEARVERYLIEAAAAASYVPRTWDVAQGVANLGGAVEANINGRDPGDILETIGERSRRISKDAKERGLWIMRDLPAWLLGPANALTLRALRNLARTLPTTERETAQAIVILTPSADVPPELAGHATVIEWPMPDRAEIAAILDAALDNLPEEIKANAAPNGTRDAAIDAAVGLSGLEAQACYSKSLVQLRKIDPAAVAKEKKRVVAREKVLEWFDPLPGGLNAVGGLDLAKRYLLSRKSAYTPEARAYGLPTPKGALIVGVTGCGKSLLVKAIGTAWGVPVLRVDMGAAKGKFVGESEASLRAAFDTIAAIGRCVVWFDEIEKAMAGATQGAADGGVSADALGFVLTWMQEKRGEAFCVATSNDVAALPPELLRRFDVTWFVDLPTKEERAEIVAASLRTHYREDALDLNDCYAIAAATEGFSGDQVASLVPEALYVAFEDGQRQIEARDLLTAARDRVPASQSASDQISRLRAWASGKARPASSTAETATKGQGQGGRLLDIDAA
jgi:hypothetical protein